MTAVGREVERLVRRHIKTVPQAIASLDRMRKELTTAKTYAELKRIQREANYLRIILGEIESVRQRSEVVLRLCSRRIAEELKKVPKAAGPGRGKHLPEVENVFSRAATGIPGTSRARLYKLLAVTPEELEDIVTSLHQAGKHATEAAVLTVLKQDEIKQKRKDFEARRDRGGKVEDLVALAKSGKRFKVIYADPAWEFKVYSGKGKTRSAERHYETQTLDLIKALPVADLADKDCALLLWAVWPELRGALEVIQAWGFEYKTVGFVWVKAIKHTKVTVQEPKAITLDGDGLHWGMGYWTRANTEVCLLATKGNPQRMAMDVHQVVIASVAEHSAKPEEVRRRIERLLIGDYLELYARKEVPGWTTWGNEVETRVEAAE